MNVIPNNVGARLRAEIKLAIAVEMNKFYDVYTTRMVSTLVSLNQRASLPAPQIPAYLTASAAFDSSNDVSVFDFSANVLHFWTNASNMSK